MRRSPAIRLTMVTVLVVALCGTTAALAARSTSSGLAGVWIGKYSGAYSGTFRLNWTLTGSRLHGTIKLSSPKGSYGINGTVGRGGAIKFGVVGAGATYTGTVVGSKMSGSYKSPGGDGKWSAAKFSRG